MHDLHLTTTWVGILSFIIFLVDIYCVTFKGS